ncbi:hypothetical protein BC940DRAFT_310056 [Gongronella butleri]|nr:hypothetical protein BC940DRAFT_310056 [Gongronella butleri]
MALLDQLQCTIDFQGQRLNEQILQAVLVLSSILAFVVGYVKESMFLTLVISGGGFVLAALLVLPPWPMYRKHPLKWVKSTEKDKTN